MMKIRIPDIRAEGLDVVADAQKNPWFQTLLKVALPEEFHPGAAATAHIHLDKVCDNLQLSGALNVDLQPTCARCLESFPLHWKLPLKMNLAPKPGHEEAVVDADASDDDDEGFSFYEGEELDLLPLLEEMIIVEVPIRYLCQENCRGLCPQCGENLNRGACSCPPQAPNSPFAGLKSLVGGAAKKPGKS